MSKILGVADVNHDTRREFNLPKTSIRPFYSIHVWFRLFSKLSFRRLTIYPCILYAYATEVNYNTLAIANGEKTFLRAISSFNPHLPGLTKVRLSLDSRCAKMSLYIVIDW